MNYVLNKSEELVNIFKQNNTVNPNLSINYFESPYHYVVIEDIFTNDVYEELCDSFPVFIARKEKPYGETDKATSKYEAYITGLSLNDCIQYKHYDVFTSLYLKDFLTNIFNSQTNHYIACAAHWHKSPSKSGFSHRDFAICSFQKSDSLMLSDKYDYTDDSDNDGPNIEKTMRSIVLLYYLNNPDNIESYIGGGTGIYNGFDGIGKLIKEVRPKNNSLFAFEITPKSYHAYVGANFDRSAIVQWYHSSPAYILNRHWDEVKRFYKTHNRILDTWRQRDQYWQFEKDPDYNKYFSDTIANLLK